MQFAYSQAEKQTQPRETFRVYTIAHERYIPQGTSELLAQIEAGHDVATTTFQCIRLTRLPC